MPWNDAGFELCEESGENGEGDWHLGLSIAFAMVTLDTSNEALYDGSFAGVEGEVHVCMHGSNVCKVLFDGFGLNATSEGGDPGHDGGLRG